MRLAKSLSSSDLRRESTAGAQPKRRLCQRSQLYRRAVAAVACGLGAPACHPPESFGCLCEQQVRLARLDRQRRCGGIPFSAAELTGRDLPAGRQQWRTHGFPTDTAACESAYYSAVDSLRLMPWGRSDYRYSTSAGYANYHALQAEFQKLFERPPGACLLHLVEIWE